MSFRLRARNTATAESHANVLEELEAGRNTPSPDNQYEPNVTKKKSTNMAKFSQSDGRFFEPRPPAPSLSYLSPKDKRAMALLVALYTLQGTAVGLTSGSIPDLLGARLSHNQIGLSSLNPTSHSLKLLWSPIVDTCYFRVLGRRKSWIIPVQALAGVALWLLGNHVNAFTLTVLIFTMLIFAATQDIALDGWALELLSQGSLPYASTAQMVGVYIGYFLSFNVFKTLNGLVFSNSRWSSLFGSPVQDDPMVTLSGYLKFGSVSFILVTIYLTFLNTDDSIGKDSPKSNMNVKDVYRIMYEICKFKHVQRLILLHFIVNVGVSVNDVATSSKLLEKGLNKDDMTLLVLIDFPFQILLGYFVAKWSSGDKPLQPWVWALWFRLAFSAWNVGLVYFFPEAKPLSNSYFILVIASMAMSGLASTVQFVGISAFHAQVADPLIGGTYMTLLNTASYLGGTCTRYFVSKGLNLITEANCLIPNANRTQIELHGSECVSDLGKARCADFHGACHAIKDGYYIMQAICIALGTILLLLVIEPASRKLGALPPRAWHAQRTS